MECACTVGVDFNEDHVKLNIITTPFARRVEICNECDRDIHVGEDYRKEIFEHHGRSIHRTCEDCLSVREVFFSDGWYYGHICELMNNFISECDGDLSIRCIRELTKTARDRVLDEVERIYERSYE